MTLPYINLESMRSTLEELQLTPQPCLAVFIGGSTARGWQHARSDADLYVVTSEPWQGEANGFNPVSVVPDAVPTHATYLDDQRWELRYWLDSQVDQVFTKIAWSVFQHDDPLGQRIGRYEVSLLARLNKALIVSGQDWVEARRGQLADSAFRSMLTLRALADSDAYVEDALGMMESADWHSAILSAQKALGAAADALTVNQGEYSIEEKWRARRMRAVTSPVLSFERYWELATMQTLDPQRPLVWIESVLELCRQVSLEVEM